MNDQGKRGAFRIHLPATSANLGSGFDTAAVALDFGLKIEADAAKDFAITAAGRDAERCGRIEENLILETYKQILKDHKRPIVPLSLRIMNEIPLGMGCGSSAAARLAAIALAVHFGQLGWDTDRILEEAYTLEGHADNVAACWLGGFVSVVCEGKTVHAARIDPPEDWRAIIVLPAESLSTSKARAALPRNYPLEDVVANLQSVAMLGLAFAHRRGELLRLAMKDRIHQPYRATFCPLLPLMLPLAGQSGILGAALSGAGPAMLLILANEGVRPTASAAVERTKENRLSVEQVFCGFSKNGARQNIETK